MKTLISPDGKTRIPTNHPSDIVRLKAQGFTVEEATKPAKAEEDTTAAAAKPAASKPAK